MSNKQKGVCDLEPSKGIANLLSDEQQRRWEDKKWANKMGDPTSTYDRTRAHLNFEVVKGGKIQAIDTSKTIMEKYQENLEARGIKDPNKGKDRPTRRILASMILSGSTARMQQLAFGNQQIDFSKGADNSHLTRNKEIEDWARDTYNFIGKRYGHQNIVSFYVHLDESWVHAHCTLVPVNEKTNSVSYDAAFEGQGKQGKEHLIKLHTAYAQEVGSKWGLERGEPVAETKAEHISSPEYKKKLVQDIISMEGKKKSLEEEIRDCERKIKSFTTMLNNLQLQKENIETEIGLLKKQFGDGEITNEELAQKLEKLNRKMENIDEKIALREKQLEETKKELEECKEKVEDAKEHLELTENKQRILRAENEELAKELSFKYKAFVSLGLEQELLLGIEKVMPSFNDEQKETFENTFIGQNLFNLPQITTCAMYLMAGYVDIALSMGGVSSGGGGGNNQGWRKKDDEDEAHWARRCMHGAAKILNTSKRNIGKKR